jgi:hypothetical protein
METLKKLFGSAARVKMMRLFLFNPDTAFESIDLRKKTRSQATSVRKEIHLLEKTGFVKNKSFIKEVYNKKSKKIKKKRVKGWMLNPKFEFLGPLRQLLINTELLSESEIGDRLKKVGRLKLVIVTGVLIQNNDSRVDMLIVGDNIKKGMLESAVELLESEIGTELRYTTFDTKDFKYRLNAYDKLIRDILDYPHQILLDKIGI